MVQFTCRLYVYVAVILAMAALQLHDVTSISHIDGDAFSHTLLYIANQGLGLEKIQTYFDSLTYKNKRQNGNELILQLVSSLNQTFAKRIQALRELKNIAQNEYAKFGKAVTVKCCQATNTVYDYRFKANVSFENGCDTEAQITGTRAYATQAVYNKMKENFLLNPRLKWQYVGLETGIFAAYPTFRLSECHAFDPRYRPWYVESATPKPKYVVLVIDTSGSMETNRYSGKTLMTIAQEAASSVIATLNPNDKVGVVTFSDLAHTPSTGCYADQMALATPHNKKALTDYIKTTRGDGNTKYGPAFIKAFSLLRKANASSSIDQVILFLTDGRPSDSDALKIIREQNSQLSNQVLIMTYGIGNNLDEYAMTILKNIANQTRYDSDYGNIKPGKFTWIRNPSNLRHVMSSYYQQFSKVNGEADDIIFSVPYVDAWGLGLVTSMCLPLYHSVHLLFGVTCIDVTVSDLISSVTYFNKGGDSYAFIADDDGRVLVHPLLPIPFEIADDPIYVDITTLERSSGAIQVLAAMKRRETGQKIFQSMLITVRGDPYREGIDTTPQQATYYYSPVPHTPFSVCIVLFRDEYQSTIDNITTPSQAFLYHRLDLVAGEHRKKFCSFFDLLSTEESSAVKFSPSAFKDPYNYLHNEEKYTDVTAIRDYMSGLSNANPDFKDGIRESVYATAKMNEIWPSQTKIDTFELWRYIATVDGVMRFYPGSIMSKHFDPATRPWYKRSFAYKGKLVLSPAYKDAMTGGYVVTLSATVHARNKKIMAVMGIDFTVGYFYSLIVNGFESCKKTGTICFLVDASGYLVVHPDFFSTSAVHRTVENVHLTEKEPEIANNLISKRILNKYGCINFETIKYQHFWKLNVTSVNPSGIIDTTQIDGALVRFEIIQVKDSNVFLVKKVGLPTRSSQCACTSNITYNPEKYECGNIAKEFCECPCYTQAPYQHCRNYFSLLSDTWPTCAPKHKERLLSVEADKQVTKGLPTCDNPNCDQKTRKEDCFGVAGCQWCAMDKSTKVLEKPFCSSPKTCPFGKTRGLEIILSDGITAGIVAAVISGLVLIVVVGVALFIGIKKSREKAEALNQRLQVQIDVRPSDANQSEPDILYRERPASQERIRTVSNTSQTQLIPDVAYRHNDDDYIDPPLSPPSYSSVMGAMSNIY